MGGKRGKIIAALVIPWALTSLPNPPAFIFLTVSSVAQSCLTLCDSIDCSMPGFPVHHQLWELAQTHVYQVGDTIQPYHTFFKGSSGICFMYCAQHFKLESVERWGSLCLLHLSQIQDSPNTLLSCLIENCLQQFLLKLDI